jgi:hypothetical protein
MSSIKLPLNVLVAYPYLKPDLIKTLMANESRLRMVVDSGAFTAWKSGNPIKLDDYCRFIETLPFKPWRYFTLDVVGDPHASLENYEIMLKRGFNPVPVFTRGEETKMLEHYYKTSDVVALGGLVGTKGNKPFVNKIMHKVAGRKVHLLGFINLNYIKAYKPYMCDSSSWEAGARFGYFPLYVGRGNFEQYSRAKCVAGLPEHVKKRLSLYGLPVNDFAKADQWKGGYSCIRRAGAASWVHYSRDVQRNLGTYVFMALTTTMALNLLVEAHTVIEEKNL